MHAFDKLHEECGVFGIYLKDGKTGVVPAAYHALYALQHRGQESCGIAVNNDGVIDCYKDVGLVNEVFTRDVLEKLHEGSMAVGHCRYGTTGTQSRGNAQPLLVNHLKGALALCHNGNLVNARELREELELGGAIFHTTSDTEVIAYIITQERLRCESIEQAVLRAMERIEGAYSLVIMSPQKLIAARDPHGFRPLCMGDLDGDVVFASESCALDAIGATFVRDIEPGETVVVSAEGIKSLKCGRKCDSSLCVFEFIYFARPDSVVDGSSVHVARLRAGAFLALDHPVQADVVIGVPDSGIDAAIGYARQSGIPYGIGFIKNKYIGRTFIQPSQKQRQHSVRIKLNAVRSTVEGKRVVLIDDSIVRGTTSAHIVSLLREAGVRIHSVSHITGGGFYENIPRSLAEGMTARIERSAVRVLPIFEIIAREGGIPERDMFNTFNMGVGMCLTVAAEDVDLALDSLADAGENGAYALGEIVRGEGGIELC